MKKINKQIIFLVFLFIIASVSAISRKDNTLNKAKYSNKLMEPRGQESYGYLDGYGSDMAYGKSDYYWLIPLVIVIGFGALLLPLLGTLMTTMITQGTINLTAGRRKRDVQNESWKLSEKGLSEHIIGLLARVDEAIDKFGNQIKSDFSPLLSKLSPKQS